MRKGGWKTNAVGMSRLIKANRLFNTKTFVNYKLFFDDFPAVPAFRTCGRTQWELPNKTRSTSFRQFRK